MICFVQGSQLLPILITNNTKQQQQAFTKTPHNVYVYLVPSLQISSAQTKQRQHDDEH
jgi:hypothetical protein